MQRAIQRVTHSFVYRRVLYFLFFILLWAGCDVEPGPEDPTGRPPEVSNLSFTPDQLDIRSLDPAEVQNGAVDIQVDVSVQVVDTDSDLDRVVFVVRSPDQNQEAIAFHFLDLSSANLYTGSFPVTFDTGITGNYLVEVYAVDSSNLLSNRALGTLSILNDGQPPVIDEVIAPATIQRPATGSQQEQLIAVVSDPDGISNVANVLFWNVNNPTATFSLFDDGDQGGDDVAGDGRFTVTIVISSTNATGTNTFAFQATDRSGLKSEIVRVDITVE